jgi:AcrR family transcriptional regulator
MSEQQDIKLKLLREAEHLFMRYGFKSITMDDVSRELGISKKTLYQYFEDKNDLVNQAVQQYIEDQVGMCKSLDEQKDDPITFMLNITDSVSDRQKQINPGALFDLKKYFKPAWDKVAEFRTRFIYERVLSNLEHGMSKGYYHKDINAKLIAHIYVHLVDFLINPEAYMHETKNFREVHLEIMKYHLRAICTEKGLKILNEKLKNK